VLVKILHPALLVFLQRISRALDLDQPVAAGGRKIHQVGKAGAIVAQVALNPLEHGAPVLLRVRAQPAAVDLRPPSVVAGLLVLVVLINGLTPYLEIKTATSWNMYANLVTADGESNHYVIRSTFDLFDRGAEYVEVVASNDSDLERYIDSEYHVPLANLRSYLADHPDATVTILRDGAEEVLTDAAGEEPNIFVDKFVSHRSIDVVGEPGCQAGFLVAR